MTSVESIGSCSLDFDASAMSDTCGGKFLTASEYTLHSSKNVPCINGSTHKSNEVSSKQEKSIWQHDLNGKSSNVESSLAEIKLPSYVGISCAISGYANYSRFCRSRDNSPARPFRKTSLESNFPSDLNSSNKQSTTNVRCSRSHSDSNSNGHTAFFDSTLLNGNRQIPMSNKVVIDALLETSDHESLNGHVNQEFSLAKEVGIGGAKSLVQQRIESLYGVPAQQKAKFLTRTGKAVPKRSPSCPPQPIKSHLDNNLPVFRHLTKDFRDQLLLEDATKFKTGAKKSISSAKVRNSKENEDMPNGNVNDTYTNGFHSLPVSIGIDECDKMAISPVYEDDVILNDKVTPVPKKEKDGHSFLDVMESQKRQIQGDIERWEAELLTDISEETSGKVRSACGKASLLLSQKFEQFRGLCLKNIEESEDTPFYTTASDLAGFWDMVMLQVKDVQSSFDHLQTLKDNNWQEVKVAATVIPPKSRKSITPISRSNPCTPKRTAKSAELAQAREEARKQLLAAKRKGRQQTTSADNSDIEIFTRESPS